MTPDQLHAYVQASAGALGLVLDDARTQRVAGHLQRTAQMAALLEQHVLPPDVEPPALYAPAPHVLRDLSL